MTRQYLNKCEIFQISMDSEQFYRFKSVMARNGGPSSLANMAWQGSFVTWLPRLREFGFSVAMGFMSISQYEAYRKIGAWGK